MISDRIHNVNIWERPGWWICGGAGRRACTEALCPSHELGLMYVVRLFIPSTLDLSITFSIGKKDLKLYSTDTRRLFLNSSAFQIFILDEHSTPRAENVDIGKDSSKMVV